MQKVICVVTNDLNQDQRMQRICTTLSQSGYSVLLMGRLKRNSMPFENAEFGSLRLRCFFERGILFYLEFNIRTFIKLLFSNFNLVNSVDLDTLLACRSAATLKGKKFVFDAHEWFTEVPELEGKKLKKRLWLLLGKLFLSNSKWNYTVNHSLAEILSKEYHIQFNVIRNCPVYYNLNYEQRSIETNTTIIYQGMVNKGRGLEVLIRCINELPHVKLLIVGNGDIMDVIKRLTIELNIEDRVILQGFVQPAELRSITHTCQIGVDLLDKSSMNYYFSLSNKYFDYIMAGIPSIAMNFPEYESINKRFQTSILLETVDIQSLEQAIISLSTDRILYNRLKKNCEKARNKLNWEEEKHKLISIYRSAFSN